MQPDCEAFLNAKLGDLGNDLRILQQDIHSLQEVSMCAEFKGILFGTRLGNMRLWDRNTLGQPPGQQRGRAVCREPFFFSQRNTDAVYGFFLADMKGRMEDHTTGI